MTRYGSKNKDIDKDVEKIKIGSGLPKRYSSAIRRSLYPITMFPWRVRYKVIEAIIECGG